MSMAATIWPRRLINPRKTAGASGHARHLLCPEDFLDLLHFDAEI